jgi:hypothetical protein
MKIQIETVVAEKTELEIEFPFFTSSLSGLHLYKVINQHKCIEVIVDSIVGDRIQTAHMELAFTNGWKEITESEFKQRFNKAIKSLKDLIENHAE